MALHSGSKGPQWFHFKSIYTLFHIRNQPAEAMANILITRRKASF